MDEAALRKLIETYEPNEEVLKSLGEVSLVGTVGGTATGKSTVMYAAIKSETEPKMQMVLSDVSRPKRPLEIDGRDYFFNDKAKMIQGLLNGDFVQAMLFPSGEIYATRISSYPESGVGTMAIVSYALDNFRRLPFKNLYTGFIVPKSYDNWQTWIQQQADASEWSDEQLQKRLLEAKQSIEFALADKEMRFILNDTPEAAAERLKQVARGEAPADEAKARETAQTNLEKLNIIS